jgi:hypothetical protein
VTAKLCDLAIRRAGPNQVEGRERLGRAEDEAAALRDAAWEELAHWTAGGPLARAVRAFLSRRRL